MEAQQIAGELLYPIWRGVPADYKARYARNVWQQFEDNIRSAAYTSRLATFHDNLIHRLNVVIRSDDVATVAAVLTSGDDRAILRLLRDETTMLVLLVRLRNEERKAELETERMF